MQCLNRKVSAVRVQTVLLQSSRDQAILMQFPALYDPFWDHIHKFKTFKMHILNHPYLSNQALEILPTGLTLMLNFSQYQTKVFCTEGMHCKDKAHCNSLWEKKKITRPKAARKVSSKYSLKISQITLRKHYFLKML